MKWIGQHIWSFISRFRDDVYLEDVSSGTIASGGNLGLDSNNKIVKASVSVTDLHGAGVDGSDNQLLTDDGDGTVTSEANLTWNGEDLKIESSVSTKPNLEIKSTTNDARGSLLSFVSDKGGAGADGDLIGSVKFFSDNSAQEQVQFAGMQAKVSEADDTDEAGHLSFQVAASNGSTSAMVEGLALEGEHATSGEVDVTIGAGAASTTTIAGNLNVTTDLTVTGDTLTFSSGNADDPAVWIKNTANDNQATRMLFLKERDGGGGLQDAQDGDECGAIYFYSYDDGTPSLQQYGYILSTIHDATSGQESGKLDIGVANHDGGTEPGISMQGGSENGEVDVTIASGVNSLTTIAGDLDIDGSVITTAGDIEITTGGSGHIVLDAAGDIALECGGGDLTCDADTITFSSANADDPQFIIKNTTADNQGARLQMRKDRGAAMVDSDRIGEIDFFGEDASQNSQQYAKIIVQAVETDHGSETGKMDFKVAEYDGNVKTGLLITGKDADSRIDVDVASGTDSVTTIAGDLTINGDQLTFNSSKGRRATFELAGYAVADGTNYMISDIMSGNKAPFLHDETSVGADGTTALAPSTLLRAAGTVMPYSGTLKIWKGWAASNGTPTVDIAIFKYSPTANNSNNDSLVLVKNTQITGAGNSNLKAWSETSFSVTVTAGDILITAIKGSVNAKTAYFTSTVEIEWTS